MLKREECIFDDGHDDSDVADSLFAHTPEDSMVQELLQLFKSFTLTVQRLLSDHLPGGEYVTIYPTPHTFSTRGTGVYNS